MIETSIQNIKIQKAIESFGKWEQRSKDSITIANKLRDEK
jgi:hypothetical protein